MENDYVTGHWIGLFSQKDGKTTIDFTEDITVKKLLIKPFAKGTILINSSLKNHL